MYTLFARLPAVASLTPQEAFLDEEIPRLRALAQRVSRLNPAFATLSRIVPDMQAQIDAIAERAAATDEGITEVLSAELDRMAARGRMLLIDDPVGFEASARVQVSALLKDGGDLMRIEARTDGGDPGGTLSRTLARGCRWWR